MVERAPFLAHVGDQTYLGALQIADGERVFVGIGAPAVSAMVARRRHAPRLTIIFESGVFGADPDEVPLFTGSPSVARGAARIGTMLDVFAALQRGEVDVGLLSAAQVDRRGNLNSTALGDPRRGGLRLPGSGGAHDIGALAGRTVTLMPHDPRRFAERVQHTTSPGWLDRPGARAAAGLPGGPAAVVTPRAVFLFDDEEMTLAMLFPGETPARATEGFPWPVPSRPERAVAPTPDAAALAAIAAVGARA